MSIDFKLTDIQIMPEEYDFNWAKILISYSNPDTGDVDVSIKLEIKAPKKYKNLDEIEKYANDLSLYELKRVVQAHPDKKHQS